MTKKIEATFVKGHLIPIEDCELQAGEEVLVRVVKGLTSAETETQEPSGNGKHPSVEIAEAVRANMPKGLIPEPMPTDGAQNYKHYLYGVPKKEL